MPEENTELLDAEEFKETLIARTQGKGDEEGLEIKKYLDNIVPNWESMRATLLHKYIQDMLKSAKDARRSEMELVLKRAVSIIPLMVLFFTAFGYLWLIAYESIIRPVFIDWCDGEESEYFSNKGDFILIFVLAIIAYINALLSITMSLIDAHGYRWQKNWEQHIDYLQAIFGIKLMQVFLGNKMKNALINILTIRFSYCIFIFWMLVAVLLFIFLAVLSFLSKSQKSLCLGFCDIVDILVFIGACFTAILFAVSAFYMRSIIVPFIEKGETQGKDTMSINPLPKLF